MITDYEYDMMEKDYVEKTGNEIPVGSDQMETYNKAQRVLAMYLQYAAGYEELGRHSI